MAGSSAKSGTAHVIGGRRGVADDTVPPAGFAAHLQSALVGAHDKVADALAAAKMAHTTDVLERFETDLAPLLAPIVAEVLANPSTPEAWRPLFEEAAGPEHFSGSLLIGVVVGAIIGPVLGSALAPVIQSLSNDAWAKNPTAPLSPEQLAAGVIKNIFLQGDVQGEAAKSGIDGNRFGQLVEIGGNALGLGEAFLLDRRGQLAGTSIEEVLAYSNLAIRFQQAALNLRYASPDVGSVLAGRVKNHLNDAQAQKLYEEAGGNPVNYAWQRDTGGRPLGLEQMAELVNRGHATDADLSKAAEQSDLGIYFQQFVPFLKQYWPPVRSILPMLRAQALTEPEARAYWSAQGVPPALQDIFVKEAAHTRTGGVKELSQSQVVAEYEAMIVDAPTAVARIETLGYSPADAQSLVALADARKLAAQQNATVRMVGARYVARRIDVTEATRLLGEIPVPAARVNELVKLWDIERQATIHVPSPAQVIGAYRREVLSAAQTKVRLLALGVDPADLAIFVADGWPPTHPISAQTAANAVVNA